MHLDENLKEVQCRDLLNGMSKVKETQKDADRSVNIPKDVEFYTSSGWNESYIKYISIKLF